MNNFFTDWSTRRFRFDDATVKNYYHFWRENLLERAIRLFKADGLPESLPLKELEQRLLLGGCVGIVAIKGELVAVTPALTGVTHYYDEFTHFNWSTPIASGTAKIGVDGVIINNNSLRTSIYPLIHRYATLLAHTEVSYILNMVNSRDDAVFKVKNSQAKTSVDEYLKAKYNGKPSAIFDKYSLDDNVEPMSLNTSKGTHYKDIWEVRNDILHNFYEDIGVKTSNEKKGNMIVDEVNANDDMLLLNIEDMIAYRQCGIEEVNDLFGTNIAYKKAIPDKEVVEDENSRILQEQPETI